MEVFTSSTSTPAITIEKLRQCFVTFGLPEQQVTDSGPLFVSEEFQQFMYNNGVRHICISLHHPSSNRQAERAVQNFKMGMKKVKEGTLSAKVARFLFNYRMTPHSTTGQSPAELMFRQQLRTRPNLEAQVCNQQARQKASHDLHAKAREFTPDTKVYVRNFGSGPPWLAREVLEKRSPSSCLVKLTDGRCFRRHVDHLRIHLAEDVPLPTLDTSHGLKWLRQKVVH